MSTYQTPFVIELSQTGLAASLLLSLTDPDDPLAPHSNSDYVDIGGWVEMGAIVDDGETVAYAYANYTVTFPAGYRGGGVFHTGVVGGAGDFTGVTVLTAIAISPQNEPVYHADIQVVRDAADSQDVYSVVWFKNDDVQTTGVSSVTVTVIDLVTGTTLINAASMSEVGSTGTFRYTATSGLVTEGNPVRVLVSATVDSGTRTWAVVRYRDSS